MTETNLLHLPITTIVIGMICSIVDSWWFWFCNTYFTTLNKQIF